ncbi:hypothetical protein TNCV_3976121 [Trichonephila clavipes]|nr:hypothetical protein TNCV_3976121 [Trichonephila clavipes]
MSSNPTAIEDPPSSPAVPLPLSLVSPQINHWCACPADSVTLSSRRHLSTFLLILSGAASPAAKAPRQLPDQLFKYSGRASFTLPILSDW